MMGQFKSWALSGAALIAGMACVAGLWSLVPLESPEIVENKVRFSELSGREQTDLRNKATAFVDPGNQSELVRLQQIHVAVKNNPALLPRLETLDALISNLDPETRAKLNPNGDFADDWADQVLVLSKDKHAGDVQYEFPLERLVHYRVHGPGVMVNGSDYEDFLDEVAGKDWGDNKEYLKFIHGDDVCLRRMFKTLVLADRSIDSDANGVNLAIVKARGTLVPAGTAQNDQVRKSMLSAHEFSAKQPEEHRAVATNLSGLKILELGLWYTKQTFLAKCVVRESVAPEIFTKHFERSEQMELMTMAPEDAAQELKAKLVSDNSVEDPRVARVNEILAESRERIVARSGELYEQLGKFRGFGNRSPFGGDRGARRGRDDEGRGDRGPGGRGPAGRGPDEARDEAGDRRRAAGQPGDGRGPNGGGPGRLGPNRQPPPKRDSAGAAGSEAAGLEAAGSEAGSEAPDSDQATKSQGSSADQSPDESGS